MTFAHVHPSPVAWPGTTALTAAVAALLTAFVYLLAAVRLRRRGDAWPHRRDVSFTAGCVGVAGAAAGTDALPGGPFTGHMIQHLVVGMAAPLLLVLAHPLTLALRALAPGRVRRALLAFVRSRPVGRLVFPPLAALLDVGGLWVLYRTELFSAMAHRPLLHGVVHAHMLAAGLLFSFAMCQLGPVRRRWSLAVRGPTLLAVGAAHGLLAKTLYTLPPPGTDVTTADLHRGAQVMYYGGDVTEAALAMVLGVGWYTAGGRMRARVRARRMRRPPRRGDPATTPGLPRPSLLPPQLVADTDKTTCRWKGSTDMITPEHIHALLTSDADDPRLILAAGAVGVVPASALGTGPYRGALEIISREDLVAQLSTDVPSRQELEPIAARLDTAVTHLGA
jgi:putative membrane protein